jgi:phosphoribosyl 1,2-cyclic phosphodiesterase
LIWLCDDKTEILLECGIAIRKIKEFLDFKLSNISGCIISHEHKDHSISTSKLIDECVEIYTSQGTADYIGLSGNRVNIIKQKELFEIGTFKIMPFDLAHDAEEPLGFLIKSDNGAKILFIPDTQYCKYTFDGITHLIIECNHDVDIIKRRVKNNEMSIKLARRIMKNHMSLTECKNFIKKNDNKKLEKIYLFHMSEKNSDPENFKKEINKLTGKQIIS